MTRRECRCSISGDPYVTHSVEVALVFADRGDAPELVVAAVLHNLSKLSSAPSLADNRARFGADVATLLAAYTKLDYREYDIRCEQADKRALRIKVAD